MAAWDELHRLRDDVNSALEKARSDKRIGKALEAHVALLRNGDAADFTAVGRPAAELADLFIVSDVELAEDAQRFAAAEPTHFAGWRVEVSEAKGEKCERCWKHHTAVGADARFPGLCPRCAAVVAKIPQIAE